MGCLKTAQSRIYTVAAAAVGGRRYTRTRSKARLRQPFSHYFRLKNPAFSKAEPTAPVSTVETSISTRPLMPTAATM